jgi:tetratricopeptide (TPR) repeat protein/predicted Ser/Thr protein kinase
MEAPAKVECPHCHHSNVPGSVRCVSCASLFADTDATLMSEMSDATMMTNAAVATNWTRNIGSQGEFESPATSLEEGSLLAERYEIIKLLGQGGMGAVYKAKDRELDRFVALKVIRPELAGHPSILQRFKQELLLARKITHRNIIRIYDLGVADGLRFITMEFVEGQDLSNLLDGGHKYTPEETVKILRQVCAALEAAHSEGVVHRDLKPQNIMIGEGGRVCVMDFGLARSMEAGGLTQAGAVMGTPAYMSPEQAKGMPADERSDLFSLGIIAYLMLTGEIPFKADSALASMLLRTQGPPTPSVQLNPAIPQPLSDIVQKSLAVDPKDRYQSATEFAKDLYDWQEGTLAKAIVTPRVVMMAESNTKKWIALAVACAVVLAAGGYGLDRWLHRPHAPVAPMTVMIADFNNHTGDPVFSGTLESTLKLALEGASFISAYDRTRVRDLGVKAVDGALDDSKAQQIANSQGMNVVVSGAIDRQGEAYQLTLRATQAVTGKSITNAEETAASKDQVLFAVSKLGASLRKALGDATDSVKWFNVDSITAASLEAVHEYAMAQDALSKAQFEDAFKHFSQAVDLDSTFGLAYAGMAAASHNLSRQQDAEKYVKLALSHIDHMTERERYRTRAYSYYLGDDNQKCVEEYGALLQRYPSDTASLNNMADCLSHLRSLPKAVEAVRHAADILPKRALYHANIALYSAYAGDSQSAAKEADVTLQLQPNFPFAFEAQAFASLLQGDANRAAGAYRKIVPSKPSLAAAGGADLAIYNGQYGEAVKLLEKAANDDKAAHSPDEAADKYSSLAYVQVQRGQKSSALAALNNALDLSKAVKTRFLAAQDYVALGETAKAQELASGLSSELQLEPQAYGKVIEGEVALKNGDSHDAVKLFTEANNILDTWIGRFDLGRAYLDAGAFTEADSEFDRCLRRRGEVLALFLDEVPTYGFFPPVYYYQGRVREGLKSSTFTESYQTYLSIRGQAGEDPLVADARRRLRQ